MKRKFYFLVCALCLLAVGAGAQVVDSNSGEFTVVLPGIEGTAVAQLVDNAGKVYGRYTLRAGENRLEARVAPGVYYLGIAVEGQYTVRRLVINH